jgi:hypothetical protein
MEQIVGLLTQDEVPPATGSGSRLGSAVVIVSGNNFLPSMITDQYRSIRIHSDMYIALLNLATIEKLS